MSTEQHEALKHAALLNAETWPAHMTLHKWADIAGDTIRTQHALIVQMAEALRPLAAIAINCATEIAPNGYANPEDWRRDVEKARDSRAAATQYLKA